MKKRKAAPHGSGSIYLDRGKHRVRLPGGSRRPAGRYNTREEAEAVLATILLTAQEAELTGYSFRQWGEVWLGSVQNLPSYRTIKSTWKTVVLACPFIDDSLATITRLQIVEWLESLESHPVKRSVVGERGKRTLVEVGRTIARQTAKHAFNYVKQAFAYAKFKTVIDTDPTADLELPRWKRRKIKEPMAVLLADDIRRLLGSKILPLEQKTVFTLAIYQGPREGELAGMDWERVDLDKGGWWIAQSYDETTKNGQTRWQPLLPVSIAALQVWWERQGWPTTGPVFPSHRGPRDGATTFVLEHCEGLTAKHTVELAANEGLTLTVQHVHVIRAIARKQARRVGERAARYSRGYDWGWQDHKEGNFTRFGWWRRVGITRRVRFHDLRDTCATHLLSGSWGPKWSLKEVSLHLGHSSVEVTEKRYAHVLDSVRSELALVTGDAFSALKSRDEHRDEHRSNLPLPKRSQVSEIIRGAGSGDRTRDVQHGKRPVSQSFQRDSSSASQKRPTVELARGILGKVAARSKLKRSEIEALATEVLQDRRVKLAEEILAGGANPVQRVEDLAGLLAEAAVDLSERQPARRRPT